MAKGMKASGMEKMPTKKDIKASHSKDSGGKNSLMEKDMKRADMAAGKVCKGR